MIEQDDTVQRLTQGREAQQLLQNPLIEGFFSSHLAACQQAFRELPMGCSIEQYQTVQHDFLALQRLHDSLKSFVTRAEIDTYETKRQETSIDDEDTGI